MFDCGVVNENRGWKTSICDISFRENPNVSPFWRNLYTWKNVFATSEG